MSEVMKLCDFSHHYPWVVTVAPFKTVKGNKLAYSESWSACLQGRTNTLHSDRLAMFLLVPQYIFPFTLFNGLQNISRPTQTRSGQTAGYKKINATNLSQFLKKISKPLFHRTLFLQFTSTFSRSSPFPQDLRTAPVKISH